MNFWYRPKLSLSAFLLLPLSALFSVVVRRRRQLRNSTPYSKPVIVVGNLTVGGTGKTPTLIWLAGVLQVHGLKPAIVSRGYRAKPVDPFPVVIEPHHSAEEVGDEPLLLKRRLGIPVVIDPERHRAVQCLCDRYADEVDVILSDDGLQHYAMYRDLEIVMIDPVRGVGNGRLIPAGPLREPVQRLQYCDYVFAKAAADVKHITFSATAQPRYGQVLNAQGGSLTAQPIRLMSGIGNFDSFRQSVLSLGFKIIEEKIFHDHQAIPAMALIKSDVPVLMTEKDFVKLQNAAPHIYYLPFDLSYPEELAERMTQQIQDLINEKNRHYSSSL
jgi:tetraacyldisaccharide 4'-kinase